MRVNTQNYQSESDAKSTDRINVPGFFHCTMTHVNDARVKKDGSAMNATIFEGEVLAGTVPGQEGKKVVLYYELGPNGEETDEYVVKCSRLAMACKLTGPGQPDRDLQPDDFEGSQFVARVEEYTNKAGKKGCSVGDFGEAVWGIDHADVSGVPKNQEAIRLWMEARGGSGGNKSPQLATAGVGAGAADDI